MGASRVTCRMLAAGVLLALAAGVAGLRAGNAPHAFLTSEFGVSRSDLLEVGRRRPVGRTLPTADNREVATLGMVHLRAPAGFYVDQLRDVVAFKRSEAVQQIGTFGTPARLEDVAGLTIPDDQLERLRHCRLHDCNLQLSAAAIDRFSRDVDWSGRHAADQANRVMRQVLVDLVNEYRRSGSAALMEYNDRREPVAAARAFESMLADRPVVLQRFPALHRHVLDFPSSRAGGVEDVIYWSREKMGPAVIITVTHMASGSLATPAGALAVASRQLYGSQYFDASLGLTLLIPDSPTSAYLLYINRSRLDVLGGLLGTLKRPIVRSRTRSAVADHLVRARDMVERRYAASRSAATSTEAPTAFRR